jgi:hypothetical protein
MSKLCSKCAYFSGYSSIFGHGTIVLYSGSFESQTTTYFFRVFIFAIDRLVLFFDMIIAPASLISHLFFKLTTIYLVEFIGLIVSGK